MTETVNRNKGPLSDYVRNYIRDGILEGTFLPGENLREVEIAATLGVSRTPIREAVMSLEAEGLVRLQSWRGLVIADLDLSQIIELYEIRTLLEGLAARLAAANATSDDISDLETLHGKAEAAPEGDHRRLSALNRSFHQKIYEAAHNRFLLLPLETIRTSLALMRGNAYAGKGCWPEILREHALILEAIRARDAEAAKSVLEQHIRSAAEARVSALAKAELEPE